MEKNKDDIDEVKEIGQELKRRADSLQHLVSGWHQMVRKLRAYGELLDFTGDELHRATLAGLDLTTTQIKVNKIKETLGWEIPSTDQIRKTVMASTAALLDISEAMHIFAQEAPEHDFLQNPPEMWRLLRATEETIQSLNKLKTNLGETWRTAWNAMEASDLRSIKTAATNARTVVDEVSWLAPYDHLKKLEWCELDERKWPSHATRYAWILHGDTLPAGLKNDPSNDPVWKPYNKAYNNLQRFLHISPVANVHITYVEAQLKAIEEGLEEYLRKGFTRLSNSSVSPV
ncbi:MAG: hypothetical protein JSU78_02545 [Deltaproteobacteria bacterium]|nr:MAG: hypothetical protein JSU78_02545 [Deltaproteobacteria bacterium]